MYYRLCGSRGPQLNEGAHGDLLLQVANPRTLGGVMEDYEKTASELPQVELPPFDLTAGIEAIGG